MKELLDFTELVNDCTGGNVKIKQSNYLSEGALPVVDQGHELIAGYIDDKSVKYKGALPCVIFGDHTCILKYVDFDFVLGADGTKVLVPELSQIDAKYLYYFLTTVHIPDRGYSRHFKYLKRCKIPLVSLPAQKKIVQILDIADSLRQKRKEQLKLLDDYLKSVFLEMFGDPDNNFQGYEITTIGDITSHIKDGPHVSPKYSDKGIPILSTRNVRPTELVLDDMKYVSSKTYNELTRRFCPKKGDVLVTKGGTTGYAKAVDFDWPFCVWVHIAVLRPSGDVEPVYLEGAMNSEYCYIQSQRFTHGIANRDLGLTRIAKIKLLKPPYNEQKKYVEIVRDIQNLKQKMRASLDEMDNHFNALMQRYFG